jgi:hypothetical protein
MPVMKPAIRPVIEIEAAQIILTGLAFAAVLADDHAGNRLKDIPGTHDRARANLPCGGQTLRREFATPTRFRGWSYAAVRTRTLADGKTSTATAAQKMGTLVFLFKVIK